MKCTINFLLLTTLILAMATSAFSDTATDYFNSGAAKQAKFDFNGAIADYSKAIELKPDYFEAFNRRGQAKLSKGDVDGAIADYTKAIELKPDDARAYSLRGMAKSSRKDMDGAIADYTKAIELKPNALLYDLRAFAKDFEQDFDGAIADWTKVIELKPDDAVAYSDRGIAKQVKGDLDGGMADLTKASELDPSISLAFSLNVVKKTKDYQKTKDYPLVKAIDSAASAGDVVSVEALLKEHPDLASSQNNAGKTPLHLAALAGSKEIADLLLASKADVNARAVDGLTPLHEAAQSGHKDIAALLLAHGADVNARAVNGLTPLHEAAKSSRTDVAALLLAHGADVNAVTMEGVTPLLLASTSRHDEVGELLRQNGGVLSLSEKFGIIDTIAILPVLDGRTDKRASANLDKLRQVALKVLEKKRYPVLIADSPQPGQRWVMVLTLLSLSRTGAAFAGILCYTAATIPSAGCGGSGREFWSGTSVGQFAPFQPVAGNGRDVTMQDQSSANLTTMTSLLLGLSKGDAEADALSRLMRSIPERPKKKKE
jgi:hypothetical protein